LDKDLLIKKKLLETDLEYHVRYFFKKSKGYSFTFSNYHSKAIDFLQKILEGKIKKGLLLMPPRHSKTLLVKMLCTIGFARNAAAEFIYACSDKTLALDCSAEIRGIIQLPEFQDKWQIDIRTDSKAKGLWRTEQGGSFWAGGFGSPIVGFGSGKMPEALKNNHYNFGGLQIVDDPLKEQDRHRALAREEMTKYWDEVLPSRKNSPDTALVAILQPLHKEDLAGHIKKYEKDFEILELPAIIDNKPLFPEVYSINDLNSLKEKVGNEAWQAKYMLNPISIGGNILKTQFFKYYKELPFLKHRWIEADTAQKTEERHDYTVFQCWGKGYEGGIYLIDQFRGRLEYSQLKQRFKDFWSKHNSLDNYNPRKYGYLKAAYIEDKSSGTQILQETKLEGNIPVVAVPRSRSKYERAVDVALPKLEAGFIYLPENASFINDFKNEVEDFTGQEDSKQSLVKMDKKKTFDDQVDCFISACEHGFTEALSGSRVIDSFMQAKLKRKRK